MDIFIDLIQQKGIHDANQRAQEAAQKATDTKEVVAELSRRIEAIALANQALLELLRERTGIQDDDVLKRMEAIDRRDGTRDGRMGGMPVECPSCGRNGNTVRKVCIYCGGKLPGGHVFGK